MMNAVFHYVLAVLEGGLSGAIFYEAEKAEGSRKVTLHLASALFFVSSLLDALLGGRELREALAANGGDENE